MTFDLNILPLFRQEGQDKLDLPGVHIAMPPKRSTRVRSQDRLIIFIHFKGKGLVLRKQLEQLLENIEKSYYSRKGTVTSALQEITEEINDILVEQNLKHSSTSHQAIAYLSLAVMRRDMLYLAQSGLMHGFLLTSNNINHIYDAQAAGRGLGLSSTTSVRLFNTTLSVGNYLVLIPKIPEGWNKNTLKDAHGRHLGVLRRRFLTDAGMDIKALVIETLPGNGDMYLLSPEEKSKSGNTVEEAPKPILFDTSEPQSQPEILSQEEPEAVANLPQEHIAEQHNSHPEENFKEHEPEIIDQVKEYSKPIYDEELVAKPAREISDIAPILKNIINKMTTWFGKAIRSTRLAASRMLPNEDEFKISSSVMAIIAIIIPVIVVAGSAFIYVRVGLNRQYASYYQQANSAMSSAKAETDQNLLQQNLNIALANLNQAETYQITEESKTLRDEIQSYLDTFNYVKRLDFQPAIAGSISSSVKIKQILATGRDIYMLDSTSGSVMRAWLTGTGYEMDPAFNCGPGQYGPYIIGKLIDIAALPRDSEKDAAIVGLDINGNLIYCEANEAPYAIALAPPHSNWGQPIAITIENGNLYVLDPITNAVWIYFGENDQFNGPANFYFTEQVPNLQSAIDMTVSQDDLLILHSDGHTTLCTYSILEEAPTECDDPAFLKDERPGRENAATISDARFFQLTYTQPPEPSIYFLDPIVRSIYQFSLKLNLVQQLRSQSELPPGVVTAFAISPTRSLFIALDHQVFIAFLP